MSKQPDKQRGPTEPWLPPELAHLAFLSEFPAHQMTEAETAVFMRKRLDDLHAHREELERYGSYPTRIVRLLEAAVPALEHRAQPSDDPEQHRLQCMANDADVTRIGMFLEGERIEREHEEDPADPVKRARKEKWDELKKNFPKEPDA